MEDMNRKRVSTDVNILRKKALRLYKNLSKKYPATNEAKSFTASRGWACRFRNMFRLKNMKLTRNDVSVDEEATAVFQLEFKKLIDMKEHEILCKCF